MEIYKLPECRLIEQLPPRCAAALGNFDGVHRGHQKLFEAVRTAVKDGRAAAGAAWTFTYLAKPSAAVPYITDKESKLQLFAECGLDYAVFEDFEFVRDRDCRSFVRDYLIGRLKASVAVCGFNFRFGRGGTGDAQLLSSLMTEYGGECIIQQPVFRKGHIISSSTLRERIIEGDMDAVYDMTGHPFSICFPVVHGKQLGRRIGIPTINQDFPAGHIIPRSGIYACTVSVGDDLFLGVANIGTRPTVSDDGRVNCETHIIDYSGILYGKTIKVDFYRLIRSEKRFGSVEELQAQIKRDITASMRFFGDMYGG